MVLKIIENSQKWFSNAVIEAVLGLHGAYDDVVVGSLRESLPRSRRRRLSLCRVRTRGSDRGHGL